MTRYTRQPTATTAVVVWLVLLLAAAAAAPDRRRALRTTTQPPIGSLQAPPRVAPELASAAAAAAALPQVLAATVLDAGSSHTGLSFYRWPSRCNVACVYLLSRDEIADTLAYVPRGLATVYRQDGGLAGVERYFVPLLQRIAEHWRAAGYAPGTSRAPLVFLKATAGLRLAGPAAAADILQTLRRLVLAAGLRVADDFSVIDGRLEAVYAWIAVNRYVSEDLGRAVVDLGGGSTQIARAQLSQPAQANINVTLAGLPHPLFAQSFLGFGLNSARKTALAHDPQLAACRLSPPPPASSASSPSLRSLSPSAPDSASSLDERSSVFDSCLALAHRLLTRFPPVDGGGDNRTFAAQYAGRAFPPLRRVTGISGYFHGVHDLFQLDGSVTFINTSLAQLQQRTRAMCDGSTPLQPQTLAGAPPDLAAVLQRFSARTHLCFVGCYVLSLMLALGVAPDAALGFRRAVNWDEGYILQTAGWRWVTWPLKSSLPRPRRPLPSLHPFFPFLELGKLDHFALGAIVELEAAARPSWVQPPLVYVVLALAGAAVVGIAALLRRRGRSAAVLRGPLQQSRR